jgi:hypothetical protein
MSPDSALAKANRLPFALACRWAGVEVPGDPAEGGYKTYCPFGELAHDDGGREPSFRVYADHAWCFACGEYFSPVKLCSAIWGLPAEDASRQMLELAGVSDPDYKEQWKRLLDISQAPDLDSLAAALRMWCARFIPDWSSRQYDSDVSGRLAACVSLLGKVRTEADCRSWLDGCKQVMAQVIGKETRR